MARAVYVPVESGGQTVSKAVTNIYAPVNGVARKVVKGYVGVEGVARQFWPNALPLGVSVTTRIYDAYASIGPVTVTTSIRNYTP